MTWVRAKAVGLTLWVVSVLLFGFTVTYPAWRHSVGSTIPVVTVPLGNVVKIAGTLWRLRPLDIPPQRTQSDAPPPPPNSRVVAYAIDRSRDGAHFPPTDIGKSCDYSVVDKIGRRWGHQANEGPYSSQGWLSSQKYVDACNEKGALGVLVFVARDAEIIGVDIDFQGSKGLAWNQHQIVRFSTMS
ncbi:hypothetical protein ONA92_04115 [Mycobacteroides salmoniphilum]|uniref:hypothetical protein n=1 Tax=Mycobacteroides salmoniphilum TaxID=404941 RepID=UPI0035679E4A